jgi:uncharacterized membrane protein YccC
MFAPRYLQRSLGARTDTRRHPRAKGFACLPLLSRPGCAPNICAPNDYWKTVSFQRAAIREELHRAESERLQAHLQQVRAMLRDQLERSQADDAQTRALRARSMMRQGNQGSR